MTGMYASGFNVDEDIEIPHFEHSQPKKRLFSETNLKLLTATNCACCCSGGPV
jgi:hypothetical protein